MRIPQPSTKRSAKWEISYALDEQKKKNESKSRTKDNKKQKQNSSNRVGEVFTQSTRFLIWFVKGKYLTKSKILTKLTKNTKKKLFGRKKKDKIKCK